MQLFKRNHISQSALLFPSHSQALHVHPYLISSCLVSSSQQQDNGMCFNIIKLMIVAVIMSSNSNHQRRDLLCCKLFIFTSTFHYIARTIKFSSATTPLTIILSNYTSPSLPRRHIVHVPSSHISSSFNSIPDSVLIL